MYSFFHQVHLLPESAEDAQALHHAAYRAAHLAGPAAVAAVEAALGFNSREEGFVLPGDDTHMPMVFADCCSSSSSSSSWKWWLKLAPLHVLGHRATVAELFAFAQLPQLRGHLVMVRER